MKPILTLLRALLIAPLAAVLAAPAQLRADSFPVKVTVTPSQSLGPVSPIWNWFGYDSPNYTYLPHGSSLLASLAKMGGAPVYIRVHHLFTSGDGSPALKWGSTGIYREDSQGNPVYDFTIADRIVDTWHRLGLKPLMQLGFMPEALSSMPDKYPKNPKPTDTIWFGAANYPPKDYKKWGDLCYEWTRHCVERYGRAEVASWRWEVWNEPNYGFWIGTPEEFFKLYDFGSEGVRRALPEAIIGGPHTSGGLPPVFAKAFFEHCLHGTNYATGGVGSPLDFIAFHAKGKPLFEKDHVRMGIQDHLATIAESFELLGQYAELKHKPVIIGESDPDGAAALIKPELGYRNLPHYASYTAASFLRKSDLAAQKNVDLVGAVTWSFEFEHAPWFSGQRQLVTQGVDLPVRHVFRMFDRLRGERIAATSDAQVSIEDVIAKGVRDKPDIGVFASRDGDKIVVLLWHYHDDGAPGPAADVALSLGPLNGKLPTACRQTRVDDEHGNPVVDWKDMGSPASPSPEQTEQLKKSAAAIETESPKLTADEKSVRLNVTLPRQSVVLLEFSPR